MSPVRVNGLLTLVVSQGNDVSLPKDSISVKDEAVVEYISGFVLKSISKKRKRLNICDICFKNCLAGNNDNVAQTSSFTTLKEYKPGVLFKTTSKAFLTCPKN